MGGDLQLPRTPAEAPMLKGADWQKYAWAGCVLSKLGGECWFLQVPVQAGEQEREMVPTRSFVLGEVSQ